MNNAVMNPFGSKSHSVVESAGSRQAQSRELAEMQTKYLMAEKFPRDVVANTDKILNAFTRPALAEKSQYQFSRGGSDIVGPSIRAAEAIAQQWGNMEFGFRELSRAIGEDSVPYSEVEAFASDLEARNRRPLQFIVRHWRDTKKGGYKLTDERDIYELIANQAQRRVRACIIAMIPGDVIDAAMQQAEVTLRTNADTSPETIAKMVEAFSPFGVTKEHIEKRIQRRLDAIQPAQVVMLKRIYASLRDDMSAPADWFDIDVAADGDAGGKVTTLKDIAAKGAKKADKPASAEPVGPTYAQLAERMQTATDVDVASLILDEGRALSLDEQNNLAKLFAEKFPA
jgi:hypothetical protein